MFKALYLTLREYLQKRPMIVLSAGGFIGLVFLIVVIVALIPESQPVTGNGHRPFFTTDDGATRFVSDDDQVPPFTAEGREAVQAMTYSCDGGKTTFIAFLVKYDAQARAAIEAAKANPNETRTPAQIAGRLAVGRLVKKPGTGEWLRADKDFDKFRDVVSPKCPDGRAAEMAFSH